MLFFNGTQKRLIKELPLTGLKLSACVHITKKNRLLGGLTLVEIFIVLGIIGVVAAITVPNLIQSYQKQATVEGLKTVYNTLSVAIQQSIIDNGPVSTWDMTGTTVADYGVFAETYILPYLSIAKRCQALTDECWAQKCLLLDNSVNSYFSAATNTRYSVILTNGMVVGFWPRNTWAEIHVDINGKKGPNIMGKDQFDMTMYKTATPNRGLYFYQQNQQGLSRTDLMTTGYPCAKTGSLAGFYCGALIFLDGWQIADDYPW